MSSPELKEILTQIIDDLGQTLNGKTIKSIQVDNNVIDVSWYETDPKKLSELGIVLATAILAFEDIHRNRNIKDILWVSAILHSRESARKKQEKEKSSLYSDPEYNDYLRLKEKYKNEING